ncbi:hypothetical protein VB738_01525 [Cyanobium gracile UHCC 0139]|uniref:Uncharacterized protein n=1 Tax=Cyanobium gracile UHCC 0139 TaxID=3110308 RepID=A0ABU5RQ96_9CYAN|nr:hypothetical protein [Cyanobium gracile]MEA5389930.1 hypothetical protein [Cyanobium gracile UHCC 0139]
MSSPFEVQEVHLWWAEARAKRWGLPKSGLLKLLSANHGTCQLSGVQLFFGDGHQQHPLFAELDHRSPGSDHLGVQVICRSLNRIKGSLPYVLFADLVAQPSWSGLMERWRHQALLDPMDHEAFERLLMDGKGVQPGA